MNSSYFCDDSGKLTVLEQLVHTFEPPLESKCNVYLKGTIFQLVRAMDDIKSKIADNATTISMSSTIRDVALKWSDRFKLDEVGNFLWCNKLEIEIPIIISIHPMKEDDDSNTVPDTSKSTVIQSSIKRLEPVVLSARMRHLDGLMVSNTNAHMIVCYITNPLTTNTDYILSEGRPIMDGKLSFIFPSVQLKELILCLAESGSPRDFINQPSTTV